MIEYIDGSDEKSLDSLEGSYRIKSFDRMFSGEGQSGYSDLTAIVNPRILKSIYMSEDWIYILVDRIASKLAQIPWQVFKDTKPGGEEVLEPALDHPVQKILDNPNPLQPSYAFKYACITDLSVTGNCLIYLSRQNRWLVQVPTEIISLDITGRGELRGYDVVGIDPMAFPVGMKTKIRPEDVAHIKRPNASSVFWGLSPLIPGANPSLFNKYSNEYLLNFYRKGAQPGLILEMGEGSNENQAKKLLASLETAYTGRSAQRRAMIMPTGVKVTTVAHTLADQQLIEYLRNNRETLINIFGVPKHELSIAEAGSLGSEEYKTALKNFWQGPLMSIGSMFESALTEKLKPFLGEQYKIRLNYSGIPILQEDLNEKAMLASSMLSTMTYNEVRQKVWKLPPIEGGDVIPAMQTAQAFPSFPSFSSEPQQVQPEKLPEAFVLDEEKTTEETLDYKKQNLESFGAYIKSDGGSWFRSQQSKLEEESKARIDALQNLWLDILGKQMLGAVKVLKDQAKEKAVEIPSKVKLRKELMKAMDGLEEQWTNGYTDALESQVELGYNAVLEVPFNKPYLEGIEAIRSRNAEGRRQVLYDRGLETFSNISKTTTENIMRTIASGMEQSLSITEISTQIRNIGKVSAARAMTIARTEVLTANSIGENEAMKDAAESIPNLVKVWVNANDERVRGNPGGLYPDSKADHWSINGEIVDHGQKFSNGLAFPRDPSGEPGQTINCRCTLLAVSEDDLGQLGLKR